MVLLGDVGQVVARFSPFGDSVNLGARLVHTLRRPWAWKPFRAHPMVHQGDVGLVDTCFGPFGDCVNLGAG
jgi:hypothetical protein